MRPVLSTLADLIRINSVNPNYDGGVPEQKIAEYVLRFFAGRNVDVSARDVFANRPNVIATVPGIDRHRRVVFEAHMDTVATSGMTIDPFDPVVRDGRMYGRGSCDTKGGMAAMMHAVAEIAAEDKPPVCDIVFVATIDEEFAYRGVADFCDGLNADAAIVAEPTQLRPVIASKGLVRWVVETRGKAAHSAKPHLGSNAITQMSRVIAAIDQDTKRLAKNVHSLLGAPTCNIGVIRGGAQINLVPASCEIEIDRRLVPGETVESVLAEYRALIDDLVDVDAVMHPPLLSDVPLDTDRDCSVVKTLCRTLKALRHPSTPIGVPFCSDASKFAAIGIPSTILGPGNIDQAHSAVEYIECQQVVAAVEIYRRFVAEFQ